MKKHKEVLEVLLIKEYMKTKWKYLKKLINRWSLEPVVSKKQLKKALKQIKKEEKAKKHEGSK